MEIRVKYLEDASEFMLTIDRGASLKLAYNIAKVSMGVKDSDIFKKLGDTDIWEFRARHGGNCYRLLSFWDNEAKSLVIATHGFVKKSEKTPKREIAKAEAIRKNYMENRKDY